MLRFWSRWVWGIVLTLVCAVTAIPAASAADESDAAVQQAPADPAEPVTVLMTEYALGPGEIDAQTGLVRLRLVNAGIRRHTLTVFIDGAEHVSPEVRPGDAADWLLQIERPGRYDLWCSEYRHLEKGMGATLVVR